MDFDQTIAALRHWEGRQVTLRIVRPDLHAAKPAGLDACTGILHYDGEQSGGQVSMFSVRTDATEPVGTNATGMTVVIGRDIFCRADLTSSVLTVSQGDVRFAFSIAPA